MNARAVNRRKAGRKKTNVFTRVGHAWKKIIGTVPYLVLAGIIGTSALYLKDIKIETVLPVERVTVEGELEHLGREQIEQMVLTNIEGGFFTLDLSRTRQALLGEPWVQNVSVRRRWPAELIVSITEKQAVAYWNSDSLISRQGEVFTPESIPASLKLPRMSGPDGQHQKVWMFMNRVYRPLASLALEVASLQLDDRRAWQLELEDTSAVNLTTKKLHTGNMGQGNHLIIKLGRYDTEIRFERFIRVFSSVGTADLKHFKVIDMRYPNGFAVTAVSLYESVINASDITPVETEIKSYLIADSTSHYGHFIQYNAPLDTPFYAPRFSYRDLMS